MKFKFNSKLTAFLVSLFLGFLLVVLGSNNKYCLSFGLIILGVSLTIYVLYNNEKLDNELENLSQQIDDFEQEYDQLVENIGDYDDNNEYIYALKMLYVRQKKLTKSRQKTIILFNLCAFALVILGFINLF